MKEELQAYRDFVHALGRTSNGRIFLNSDPDHAIIVFEQIFDQSKDIVRIFAGRLTKVVGNSIEYITSLSDFVERGGKIRILLNDYNEEEAKNSNLYKRLAYYQNMGKSIIVKSTSAKPYRTSDPEKKEIHFTVGDNNSYRIETDTVKRTAECSLNNTEVATSTADFFDMLFESDKAQEIDIKSMFGYVK